MPFSSIPTIIGGAAVSQHPKPPRFLVLAALILSLALSGCTLSLKNKTDQTPTPAGPPNLEAGGTLVPPSPTPVPAAAWVNGEPISIDEYQAELERYTAALIPRPSTVRDEHKQTVIDDLVTRLLLAQNAAKEGYTADDAQIQARIDSLVQQIGGPEAWQTWLTENKYTAESFKSTLTRDAAAAWMRDKILASVPTTAEQVHARQMLFSDSDQAKEMVARLQAGEKFEDLAQEIDPTAGGDLGWFPRKYLLFPELDAYFFGSDSQKALLPGETSQVVQTRLGYHILQTIEQDPRHPLSPQALLKVQSTALADWVDAQKANSTIEITLPK